MLNYKEILIKNKEVITAVALYKLNPDKSSTVIKEILEAYKEIDNTLEALHGCATCQHPFENSFKVILAYCDSVNWFNETAESFMDNHVKEVVEGLKKVKSKK